jgi:hypothetical protein
VVEIPPAPRTFFEHLVHPGVQQMFKVPRGGNTGHAGHGYTQVMQVASPAGREAANCGFVSP